MATLRDVARAVPAIGFLLLTSHALAGDISKPVGSVGDLLTKGYKFVAGDALGAEVTSRVAVNENAPIVYGDRKTQTGTAYLQKDSDLLVCTYVIVLVNDSFYPAGPGSACYRIR